jgi:hypothetical protein
VIPNAFADAEKEVISRYGRPYADDWQHLASEARRAAEKLAKDHGEAMGAYVRSIALKAPVSRADWFSTKRNTHDLLALLTLDALEMHADVARLALHMITQREHAAVLLKVSFCSPAAREATANLLVPEYIKCLESRLERGPRKDENWEWTPLTGFLAVAGDQQTAELLSKAASWAQGQDQLAWREAFECAAKRVSSRLLLPPEQRAQHTKDELLYWQTAVGAPCTRRLKIGLQSAAAALIASGYSISPSYLIERLDEIKGFSPKERRDYNGYEAYLTIPVLCIIAAQKEDAAVPAAVGLALRRPDLREDVEDTLKQIGSPNAKEALRTLEASNSQPKP